MIWLQESLQFSLKSFFVRGLHAYAHNIEVYCVTRDPAFYARAAHKVNARLENTFKRPKQSVERGRLQDALFTFVDTKPWESPPPCNCQEAGTIQSYAVALTAQGHFIFDKVIFPAVLPPSTLKGITGEDPACFILMHIVISQLDLMHTTLLCFPP